MKIRPAVLLGELILGAGGILLVLGGHIEGAVGVFGIIGATMHKLVDSEEKSDINS